jgi:hypothetical protein
MIPAINNPVWRKIATGEIKIASSSKLALNLLATNIQRSYARDRSEDSVQAIIKQAYEFFTRYEALFPAELAAILKDY